MAELLCKAVDYVHPNPDTDRRGAYKRGDVVVVMPDGHQWGTLEGPPTFFILKLPGESVASFAPYAVPEFDDLITPPAVNRRRAWGVLVDELPPGIQTALLTPGSAMLPLATLLGVLERKADHVRADEV